VLAVLAAVVFSVLVLITGKGDAMSGGGSVRTTYKGKATFDDIISRATLYTGIAFMVLVLCYQVLNRPSTSVKVPTSSAPASTPVEANLPVAPATNVPATNTTAPSTPAPSTAAPSTPAPTAAVPSAPATNTPAGPAAGRGRRAGARAAPRGEGRGAGGGPGRAGPGSPTASRRATSCGCSR
jgi:preprotein translocase subunit SecG